MRMVKVTRAPTDYELTARQLSFYELHENPADMPNLFPPPPPKCAHVYWLRSEYTNERKCIDCGKSESRWP